MTAPGARPEPFVLPVGELPRRAPATRDLERPGVAVAVGAHPDDIEFGSGGTLAKWAAAGGVTHHVVLTDGSKGTWDADDDLHALVATRQLEQRAAAEVLGSRSVTFLGYVDGELESGLEQRRALCAALRQLRPDVVLGHDPWRRYRLHPDHRHAGWLTVDAVVAARDPAFFPDLRLPAHRPSTLLLFEPDEPDHVEDIASTIEAKVDALLAHRSQHRTTMGMDADNRRHLQLAVEAQAARHGALAALPAGEAFHRIDNI